MLSCHKGCMCTYICINTWWFGKICKSWIFYFITQCFMANDHQSSDTIDDICICIEFLLGNALRSGNPQWLSEDQTLFPASGLVTNQSPWTKASLGNAPIDLCAGACLFVCFLSLFFPAGYFMIVCMFSFFFASSWSSMDWGFIRQRSAGQHALESAMTFRPKK